MKILKQIYATLIRKRGTHALRVVDQTPLLGAGAAHVIDVDGYRLVFASAPGAICLLAQFKRPPNDERREEGAAQIADIL